MKSYKNLIFSFFAISALLFSVSSCTKDSVLPETSAASGSALLVTGSEAVTITGGAGSSVILYAGQTINVGSISFDDIDTNGDSKDDALTVTYNITNGWQLGDVALWIGTSLSSMPANKSGNPTIGKFPFKGTPVSGQNAYTFVIPFTYFNYVPAAGVDFQLYVAAHANVSKVVNGILQTETAWGNGPRIVLQGSWAMYFGITLSQDQVQPEAGTGRETAFAYSPQYSQTFYSLLNSNTRWGWSNGPLSAGTYTFDLYAAAGNNLISNGTLVGNVILVYNGSSATVTYNVNSPYKLEEVHAYVGADFLPKLRNGNYASAPGQYPNTNGNLGGLTQYVFNISGLSGQVYFVAHATVSGF